MTETERKKRELVAARSEGWGGLRGKSTDFSKEKGLGGQLCALQPTLPA